MTTIEIRLKYDGSPYEVIRTMRYETKEEAVKDNRDLSSFLANYVK